MPPISKAALTWHLEWGSARAFLERRAEQTGKTPPALMAEPEILPHLHRLLELFFLLAPSRPIGMGGAGAIPTADILAAAPHSGLPAMEFLSLCRTLDSVYLERLNRSTNKA